MTFIYYYDRSTMTFIDQSPNFFVFYIFYGSFQSKSFREMAQLARSPIYLYLLRLCKNFGEIKNVWYSNRMDWLIGSLHSVNYYYAVNRTKNHLWNKNENAFCFIICSQIFIVLNWYSYSLLIAVPKILNAISYSVKNIGKY